MSEVMAGICVSKPESFSFNLEPAISLNSQEISRIIRVFNQVGCVRLSCRPSPNLNNHIIALQKVFGSPIFHRDSDQNGIVTITPVEGAAYTALTTKAFTFHSDGVFMKNPPKVVILQCEVPAAIGGRSQLISAEAIYQKLVEKHPDTVDLLFDKDAVSTSTIDGERTTLAIFREERDRVQMSFRPSDNQVTITPKREAKKPFDTLSQFIESPSNYHEFKLDAHQILILDNTRFLHNRTPFQPGQSPPRKLYRLWLDGQSSYSEQLNFGFAI